MRNYNYHNIICELYYKFTYNVVVDQFDFKDINYQAWLHNKPQYQLLYNKFKELLKSMSEIELKNVMKFITSAEIIPAFPKIKVYFLIKYFVILF